MNLKVRLAVMNFLEFAVWGAYLTSMGNYLGKAGMGAEISWFYTIQGIVSIFMPTLMGIVADKYIQPQRLLGYCHLLAGAAMIGLFGMGQASQTPNEVMFIAVYTFSVAFYMPTLALSNTSAFSILKSNGLDTVKAFPPIRVFGTVGFILTMWIVNCATWDNGSFSFLLSENAHKFQYTHYQFLVSGVLSILLFLYCFSLPSCPVVKKEAKSWVETWGFDAFKLFKQHRMAIFFIFSMLLGVSLQITNGYANPFITSFKDIPEYANSFGANNANALISLSQISETCCILLIPFFLKRYGIKRVMMIAMFAWVLRFGLFGLGNPGPGVWMFVLSMIVYGVAFDFFNISGALFVEQNTNDNIRSSAQGLFMIMTNGLGAAIGTYLAQLTVNHFVYDNPSADPMAGWQTCWYIFAGYAFIVLVLFTFMFRENKKAAK